MDMEKYLILLKGEDKTQDIYSLKNDRSGRVEITFLNGATYPYAGSNVEVYQNPLLIMPDHAVVFADGKRINGMKQAQVFKSHVRIIYNSSICKLFEKSRIQFVYSSLTEQKSKDCFEYLKHIAHACGLHNEQGESILGKHYDKIDFVRADCILASFLSGKPPLACSTASSIPFYPFGFNISQKTAVELALKHPLSTIEGPPGTGKTQTILNIIANAVMNNESVAVVSNNNSATANVLEKLQKNGVGLIAAFLGNSQNKNEFIDTQTDLPDLSGWKMERLEELQCRKRLQELFATLNEMLGKKNSLSGLQQELENIELENKHFEKYCGERYSAVPPLKSFRNVNSQKALRLWLACESYALSNKPTSMWTRLKNFFCFGIADKAFYSLPVENMISVCQKHFYTQKISELHRQSDELSKALSLFSFDEKMKEYTELSMKLFKACLYNKYEIHKRKRYVLADLLKKPDVFLTDYPVILSTTHSLSSSLSNVLYDYVIIDEASQVDLVTGALALFCAKKAVIVGDLKQLPNVVENTKRELSDDIFQQFSLPEYYRYSNHSLLRSVSEMFPDLPKTQLREHYRCHPKIIDFCNQKFYNNQLIILTEAQDDRKPLMVYETVPGNHARQRVNRRQIEVIQKEILPQQHLNPQTDSIGIVTPYRNQTNELQEIFRKTGIIADTVDKFQGRENDVIILSTVDNEITSFTDDAHRLNVAVSRAVRQLILLVHGNEEKNDTNINDLIQYIKYNNLEVVKSEIHSIFDYLFQSYNTERKALLKRQKRISKYDSENLMYNLICDVLRQERFSKYGVAVHMPLKMILRAFDKLDNAQMDYAMNPLTHIDFLLFNKLGKVPVLAVEVDGASFHAEASRQKRRDKMKEDILRKYGLPLMRFRTDESEERERLEAALTGSL